jgi:hypothetical protein
MDLLWLRLPMLVWPIRTLQAFAALGYSVGRRNGL